MTMTRLHHIFALTPSQIQKKLNEIAKVTDKVLDLRAETIYYIESDKPLSGVDMNIIEKLLTENYEEDSLKRTSHFRRRRLTIEIGPRLTWQTSWSTIAVSRCHSCGIADISRFERSVHYLLTLHDGQRLSRQEKQRIEALLHDKMTQAVYPKHLTTFETDITPESMRSIDLLTKGIGELDWIKGELGLSYDEQDREYIYNLFACEYLRNPTEVEIFKIDTFMSNHCRHNDFRATNVFDRIRKLKSLWQLIKHTLEVNPANSVLAFRDNSSAIQGFDVRVMMPEFPGRPSRMVFKKMLRDITCTAETHNHPCLWAPIPGAETCIGGILRDGNMTGRGSRIDFVAAGFSVGQLLLPDFSLPWEDPSWEYGNLYALPKEIYWGASFGDFDYGNKFGVPTTHGFKRSTGLIVAGERIETVKPVIFGALCGQISDEHLLKREPQPGMLIIQLAGPALPIGVGGGSASSMVSGESSAERDYDSVQRGDALMEKAGDRAIETFVNRGEDNPIENGTDCGAGGIMVATSEVVAPAGGIVNMDDVPCGDRSMNEVQFIGNEAQERWIILVWPRNLKVVAEACEREGCPWAQIGEVTGDGRIVYYDSHSDTTPINFRLSDILNDSKRKIWTDNTVERELKPLELPEDLTILDAYSLTSKFLSNTSAHHLTDTVDKTVGGRIIRQQDCGPLQLPVADATVAALGFLDKEGSASALGENPPIALINPAAGSRMAIAEAAVTKLSSAYSGPPSNIKCQVNEMWAAKLPGEGVRVYRAVEAASQMLEELGMACDGGKDSFSLAAHITGPDGSDELVKSPGHIVITAYTSVPDVSIVSTPDIKKPGQSKLVFVDLAKGKCRLGGSALAQVHKQLGNEAPDIDDFDLVLRARGAIQQLLYEGRILSMHSKTGNGLLETMFEMAFSGNCGLKISCASNNPISYFFNEEAGWVFECLEDDERVNEVLELCGVSEFAHIVGHTIHRQDSFSISIVASDGTILLDETTNRLRRMWEELSYALEQTNPDCVQEEMDNLYDTDGLYTKLIFTPKATSPVVLAAITKPKAAILREQGTNGDAELRAAYEAVGFEAWDVAINDIKNREISLDIFQHIALAGGFVDGDTFGAGKGLAVQIEVNDILREQFEAFMQRADVTSLGICNGFQIGSRLNWYTDFDYKDQPRLVQNNIERFRSRLVSVQVMPTNAVMLREMEGAVLLIIVAHGEGRLFARRPEVIEEIVAKGLAPLRYVDDHGQITEASPWNPNGSPYGIAALCSENGQHFGMMPHSERVYQPRQYPWKPEDWNGLDTAPWLKFFQNIYYFAKNS